MLHLLDVVAVERADVAHAERLEERRRLEELAHACLERIHRRFGLVADDGKVPEELLEAALATHVHRVGADVGESVRQLVGDPIGHARMVGLLVAALCARRQHRHGGGVRTAVVVEDDDDLLVAVADVVDRLVGHTAGQRPVADHRNDVAVRVGAEVAGHGHAVGVREHGRGVAVLDVVVFRFLAAGIAGQPALLAQLLELLLAAGDDLVDVGLVAGVPEDRVGRRLEHPVHREGEFDGAEIRAEVAAGVRHRGHDEVADLAGEVAKFIVRQVPQIGGLADSLQIHAPCDAISTAASVRDGPVQSAA